MAGEGEESGMEERQGEMESVRGMQRGRNGDGSEGLGGLKK